MSTESYTFFDEEFDTVYNESYFENSSCFSNPKKINYYKTSYLSHNTFTFLLTNRQCVEGIIKKDKKILSHLLNRDY